MESSNKITKDQIDKLFNESEKHIATVFNKCTIMSVKLNNGFVLVESSACVDAKNYDKQMGIEICKEKIINKLWELEGYKLQCQLND